MTFIMGINNWPTFTTTLKNLHIQHFGENITNNNGSLNDGNLVKNDLLHVCNIMNIGLIVFINYLNTLMSYSIKLKIIFSSQNFNQQV
jgi:hypothetical protein